MISFIFAFILGQCFVCQMYTRAIHADSQIQIPLHENDEKRPESFQPNPEEMSEPHNVPLANIQIDLAETPQPSRCLEVVGSMEVTSSDMFEGIDKVVGLISRSGDAAAIVLRSDVVLDKKIAFENIRIIGQDPVTGRKHVLSGNMRNVKFGSNTILQDCLFKNMAESSSFD